MDKKILINFLSLALLGAQAQTFDLRLADEELKYGLDSITYSSHDSGSTVWAPSGVLQQTFDSKGRLIEEKKYDIRPGQRQLVTWRSLTYNDLDKVTSKTEREYLDDTLALVSHHELTYNDQGFISVDLVTSATSASQPLTLTSKVENIFLNGAFIEEIHSIYENNVWVNHTKKVYTFNSAGRAELIQEYLWNSNNVWTEANSKVAFKYAGGKLVTRIDSSRQSATSPWTAEHRYEYAFDTNDNTVSETHYVWNEDSAALIGDYRYEYVVDTTQRFEHIYSSAEVAEKFTHKLDSTYFYLYQNGAWDLVEVGTVHYSPFQATPVIDSQLGTATLYLDANNQVLSVVNAVNLDQAQVALFDIQGRRVLAQEMTGQGVSLQHLHSGTYVYQFSHQGRMSSGRLVK
ncbi:MAG TPA: T9SS type A sorting domain-containing protein [Cytophagales bacterium]|nr:T9SS type A sorting domain-containing protein [Cytophagales bacterium]